MQTGSISSWLVSPLELGPLYPFAGSEVFWVAVCALLWIFFLLWLLKVENDRCCRETEHLSRPGMLGTAVERQSQPD